MDYEYIKFIKDLLIKDTPLTTVQAGKLVKAVEDLLDKNNDLIAQFMNACRREEDYERDIKYFQERHRADQVEIEQLRANFASLYLSQASQEGNHAI